MNSSKSYPAAAKEHNKLSAQREQSYRLAKLLRSGSRELSRQLNIKKARRTR